MRTKKTIFSLSFLALFSLILAGCGGAEQDAPPDPVLEGEAMSMPMPDMEGAASADETLYQCPMHPNIVDDEPGQCPICGMDLQPVQSLEEEGIEGRAPVRLTDVQRQLINIRVSPATMVRAIKTLEAPAVVQHDASRVFTISAWAAGRIEKLHVDQEETYVEEGDVLYEIYSPDLYAAMQEYVSLSDNQLSQENLAESARVRLIQIGLRPEQIEEIAESGEVPLTLPIKSPASGIVMMKMVREGAYVNEGENLFTVVDLSELWLIAEVYESDLPFVSPGQRVVATSPAVPGETFIGTIELINHHIDPKTRTAQVRILFDNPEQIMQPDTEGGPPRHRLLPDMWMTARLEDDLGQRLVIPRAALFDTGRRQYVFVESDEGVFVPTEIKVGPRLDGQIVVSHGLEEGARVVTDGVFLLDSESLLKASVSGGAADPEAAEEADESAGLPQIAGLPEAANDPLDAFWSAYLSLREALAQDSQENLHEKFGAIRAATDALQEQGRLPATGKRLYLDFLDGIANLATLPEDADLQAARVQFGMVSEGVIEWAGAAPEVVIRNLKVASCPMWKESPAQWVQVSEEIQNPFMGQAMPSCGTIDFELPEGGER